MIKAMLLELKPGKTYTINRIPVTLVTLEGGLARVIPHTGHNPVEGEPVQVALVDPGELKKIHKTITVFGKQISLP